MYRKTYYREDMIVGKVPKKIRERTKYYMDEVLLSLYDAFTEAVRDYGKKCSKKLSNAWNTDDFREYIPSAYYEEYLDFEKYPLRY